MDSKLVFTEDRGGLRGWDSAVLRKDEVSDERVARELVQNALDAKHSGEPVAVDFYELKLLLEGLPHIEAYKEAFRAARATFAKSAGNTAQQAVARIETVLDSGTVDCLVCVDNGRGLTGETLKTLYAEGLTDKPNKGRGSVGHGHLTAFAPSRLRYVFYAARNCASGTPVDIFGGHAILATQNTRTETGGSQRSSDGYICDTEPTTPEYVSDMEGTSAVPKLLEQYLPDRSGSVVLICGYEPLEESSNGLGIAERTLGAIAKNFMVAIQQGQLTATYHRRDGTEVECDEKHPESRAAVVHGDRPPHIKLRCDLRCNEEHLECLLKKLHHQRTRTKGKVVGPAGVVAYDLWCTLNNYDEHLELEGELAGVEIWLRQLPAGQTRTRVAVYREGMWITDDCPRLGMSDFGDRVPFSAVVNLTDTGSPNCLEKLVREAEGSTHLEIKPKSIGDPSRREQLLERLKELQRELAERVKERETETYTPQILRLFEIGTVGHAKPPPRPRRQPADIGPKNDVSSPDNPEDGQPGNHPGKKTSKREVKTRQEKPDKGNAAGIRTSARLLDGNEVRIGWLAVQGFTVGAVGIRVIIPGGSDETSREGTTPVYLKLRSVEHDGKVLTPDPEKEYEIVIENPEKDGTAVVKLAHSLAALDAPMISANLVHRRSPQDQTDAT